MLASLPLPKTPRTTLSVCRIGGGTSINTIPEQGWLEVDLRSTSESVLDRFDREIRIIVRAAAQQENARRATATPPLAADVMVIGARPSGEISSDHPLVLSAIEATRLIDREPELAAASTDANVPIAAGIPAIAIGAGGRGGEAHTTGEWYDNVDGPLGIARAMTILATAAELA
jgi:acetylornithine deacetylase/succinyl-diaminopimelate desuccinylase-like protein